MGDERFSKSDSPYKVFNFIRLVVRLSGLNKLFLFILRAVRCRTDDKF